MNFDEASKLLPTVTKRLHRLRYTAIPTVLYGEKKQVKMRMFRPTFIVRAHDSETASAQMVALQWFRLAAMAEPKTSRQWSDEEFLIRSVATAIGWYAICQSKYDLITDFKEKFSFDREYGRADNEAVDQLGIAHLQVLSGWRHICTNDWKSL